MTKRALNSCFPFRKTPFPPWPFYASDEISSAMAALQSGKVNYWTGDVGRQFEKEYAAYVGTDYAVAMMNGTVPWRRR
jgi:dTDP-4-amino-4,6-dideoxygalactose transaminase